MNPDEIGRILDEIGKRLGPAGEYAWTKTVQYISIQAWGAIILSSLFAALGLFLLIGGLRRATWSDTMTKYDFMSIAGGALLIMVFIAAAAAGPEMAGRALVPEGALIKDLLP